MNRVLLIIGGLLVGLLSALFLVPVFVDWTRYRGVFEEEATRLLGRAVRVDGHVNLRLLPVPYVRFERIRIADTRAAVGEPLFRADDFTIWLSASALLAGELKASEIELTRPVLTLVLDGAGGGNWGALGERRLLPSPAFAPTGVSLDQVRITNGAVLVFSPDGEERTRFEHINGEVSAAALDGPYRVNVAYAHAGAARELRLATAKADAEGAVRFKASVRSPQSAAVFTVDGTASDLFNRPRVRGELTARLPFTALTAGTGADKAGGTASVYDLKAELTADTGGAGIKDIALSFEQDGRPQLAVGNGFLAWHEQGLSTLELTSKWLDLDRIAGRTEATSVVDLINRLLRGLESVVPTRGKSRMRFVLEQATLGGDIASGLDVAIDRSGGPTTIRAAASLPGGTRFDSSGVLTAASPLAWYDGEVNLRGASLAKFASWLLRNSGSAAIREDGPFSLQGKLAFGRERVAARDLILRVGGNSLSGEATFGWSGGTRLIALSLDGSDLDASPFLELSNGRLGALGALAATLAGGDSKAAEATTVRARVRLGRLTAGRATLRDVVTDVALEGGQLSVAMLRLGTPETYQLELTGNVTGFLRREARGDLAYLAAARTRADLEDLAAVLGLEDAVREIGARADVLLPARLAGHVRLVDGAAGKIEVTLDGALNDTRSTGVVRVSPRGNTWFGHEVDAALSISGDDLSSVLRIALPSLVAPASEPLPRTPAHLSLRSLGVPRAGLATMIAFDSATTALEWRGRVKLSEGAPATADGTGRIMVADLARLAAEFGVRDLGAAQAITLSGTGHVLGSVEYAKLEALQLSLGGGRIHGRIEIDSRQPRRRLAGSIRTDRFNLPQILAGFTHTRSAAAEATPGGTASRWNEEPIELGRVTGFDARINLEATEAVIAPKIAIRDVKGELVTETGRVSLTVGDARALGGKLTGSLRLDRAQAGARMAIEARLTGAELAALSTNPNDAAATGGLSLTLALESAGLSQRGLVAGLRGSGELKLGKARLNRFSPRALQAAADEFVATPADGPRPDLAPLIAKALAAGPVQLGDRTLSIEVADGVARLGPIVSEDAGGRIIGSATIDAEAMTIESDWRIEAAAQQPEARLPAIVASYSGPLERLGAIEPRMIVDALERELTVRRMERDLAELERLRRLDEERARAEAERLRQLEMEQQQPLAPMPPPQGQQGTVPKGAPPTLAVPMPMPAAGQPPVAPGPDGRPAAPAIATPPGAMPPAGPSAAPLPPSARRPPPLQHRDIFRELGRTGG